jgi:hypothetical protein
LWTRLTASARCVQQDAVQFSNGCMGGAGDIFLRPTVSARCVASSSQDLRTTAICSLKRSVPAKCVVSVSASPHHAVRLCVAVCMLCSGVMTSGQTTRDWVSSRHAFLRCVCVCMGCAKAAWRHDTRLCM